MLIQINATDVEKTEPLTQRATQAVEKAMAHFQKQITRVEVHLHGHDGPDHTHDNRVTMEARLAGLQPIAVDASTHDMYEAIDNCAKKLHNAVEHKVGKLAKGKH